MVCMLIVGFINIMKKQNNDHVHELKGGRIMATHTREVSVDGMKIANEKLERYTIRIKAHTIKRAILKVKLIKLFINFIRFVVKPVKVELVEG